MTLKEAKNKLEKEIILSTLLEESGCRNKTAARLGICRAALWGKIKKHGISTDYGCIKE